MAKNTKKYIVTVDSNPDYCGIGAGGAQFAHGQAVITDDYMANWFRNHKGYTVTEANAKETARD